jgi:RNA polymerase sigma-32 factor
MSRATNGRLDLAIRAQRNWSSLTAERERQLLRVCQTSSDTDERRAALTTLWESHSKLVVAIARRYRRHNIELVDLIGTGHLGLHTAIARFDVARFESRLATYAIAWIRWHIQDYIRRNAAPVRLPASAAHRQLARSGRRLFADARRSCERENVDATEAELHERIGRRIGLDADEVARSLRLINEGAVSIQSQPAESVGGPNLEEMLADQAASPEDDVILRLDRIKVRNRIKVLLNEILKERERAVFIARCMPDDDEVMHLETLAHRFGVTRERVCQLEASAKRKIAMALAAEGYSKSPLATAMLLPAVRAQRRAGVASAEPQLPATSVSLAAD